MRSALGADYGRETRDGTPSTARQKECSPRRRSSNCRSAFDPRRILRRDAELFNSRRSSPPPRALVTRNGRPGLKRGAALHRKREFRRRSRRRSSSGQARPFEARVVSLPTRGAALTSDGSGARAVVEDGELAERLARSHSAEHSIALDHFQLAFRGHVQMGSCRRERRDEPSHGGRDVRPAGAHETKKKTGNIESTL